MEQPGKFLPCPSRAGHRYPEDMADPLRRLPSTTEDLQVVIPCRNRALFLQRGIRITLQEQRSRKSLTEVARENGVGAETLRNWVKAYEKAHPQDEEPLTVSERARLRELERENQELKLEREFLGKAAAYFAKERR